MGARDGSAINNSVDGWLHALDRDQPPATRRRTAALAEGSAVGTSSGTPMAWWVVGGMGANHRGALRLHTPFSAKHNEGTTHHLSLPGGDENRVLPQSCERAG